MFQWCLAGFALVLIRVNAAVEVPLFTLENFGHNT